MIVSISASGLLSRYDPSNDISFLIHASWLVEDTWLVENIL